MIRNLKSIFFATLLISFNLAATAINIDNSSYIATTSTKGAFKVSDSKEAAPMLISSTDFPGVIRAFTNLQTDIYKVTGVKPELYKDTRPGSTSAIIAGTLGKSSLIDSLANEGLFDAKALEGKWEKFIIKTVKNPMPGIKSALLIVGSDKRGTIFGIYDVSTQIGVSPWYYMGDAPVQTKEKIYVKAGTYTKGEPKVKYRGIFINDEDPALGGWAREKFGGVNHKMYEHVFELILRLKGNYLWPAMWGKSIFEDDPLSDELADEFGIVIATSHHEPMHRAHSDWYRFNGGQWNYDSNKEKLHEFWREGIERKGDKEGVVTMGMRGDGDEAMSEETAVDLLKDIIADQRKIIEEVTGKPAEETPQVWAVYKEVQDYYDKGMRVDDDITILFCDDNWGNVQILPKKDEAERKGGYGMYYHYDYVGGPVSYKWQNVTQIEKVWEQMNLAYQWGVKNIWIANVGDIKPMELPISFWLDFAWNPEAISHNDLPNYYKLWATQQFGAEHADEIATILSLYTKYNARRTPEAISTKIYSLSNYKEADRVVEDYKQLAAKSQKIYEQLPESHKPSYYQLVNYPVAACANLYEMMVAASKNNLYANQGRISANFYADKVEELFARDAELTRIYHEDILDGKWNHMMAQSHIDFTTKEEQWRDAKLNKMPAVNRVQGAVAPSLGYVAEEDARRGAAFLKVNGYTLPTFDPINDQEYYIELFNNSDKAIDYKMESDAAWIKISSASGTLESDKKVFIGVDWDKVPKGTTKGNVKISGSGRTFYVGVPIKNTLPESKGFVEKNGVVAFEANNFSQAVNTKEVQWITVPNLGRTASAVTMEPANANQQEPSKNSPYLKYTFSIFDSSNIELHSYLSPTLNYQKNEGLKFAVSINDEDPVVVNMNEDEIQPLWEYPHWWNTIVMDHIRIKTTKHAKLAPGTHTLKVYMIDPGVVFQKFVINAGGLQPSYLGPEQSKFIE